MDRIYNATLQNRALIEFDFFSGNSTMAFFNKSLRPVEQYWNAMMHWKNIWFAFIKFLLLLSKKVRIFLGYIYLLYVLPFCIRFTPSPICTLLSYWTFCAIISFRCFETFCDGPYVFPCVSMNCLIGVTFVLGSLQWNLPLIIILCDCSLKEYCV